MEYQKIVKFLDNTPNQPSKDRIIENDSSEQSWISQHVIRYVGASLLENLLSGKGVKAKRQGQRSIRA